MQGSLPVFVALCVDPAACRTGVQVYQHTWSDPIGAAFAKVAAACGNQGNPVVPFVLSGHFVVIGAGVHGDPRSSRFAPQSWAIKYGD